MLSMPINFRRRALCTDSETNKKWDFKKFTIEET